MFNKHQKRVNRHFNTRCHAQDRGATQALSLFGCDRDGNMRGMGCRLHPFCNGDGKWGHGKGFRNEMLRLGIDESYGGGIRDGSPTVRIMQETELRQPGLAARMRECLASPLRSTKQEDFAFFRMVLERGNK